jgi:hypothetical protein
MADFKKSVDALQFIKDLSMPQQAGKIVKASDAYAPFADQGIFTAPTMADRTIASAKGKLKGGMRFPHLQNVDPAYEGEVWGFGAGNMSTRLLNQFENVPSDKLLLSTILGNKYMHHSNPEVSAELIKQYRKGIKDKKLSNELRDVTNRRINQLTDDDGLPIFAPDSDVTDPAFYRSLDTFDKRAAMGNIMGGVGLNEGTERKRRVANQIFDYEGLMRKMTEPSIIGAPNSSIGSRIFTLSGTKSERPDLNRAYPHLVGGLDLNVDFGQVPFQHYLKDYTDNMMQQKGKVPGWFNLTRSSDLPTQEITDRWLQHLKDRGYADGGQVEHMQAGGIKKAIGALGELAQAAPKKVTHGMLRRHGMEIGNKEEADALYSSGHRIFGMHELDEVPFEITDRKLFDSYAPDMMLAYPPEKPLLKAEGGAVEHMQAGGVKKAFSALTQLEKDYNLTKFLEQSVVKDRLYHGTGRDITSFRPNLESGATFLTPNPAFANKFAMDDLLYDANSTYRGAPSGANVMPVYAQVKNPWDYENPKHIEAVAKILDPQDRKAFRKQAPTGNWLAIEDHYPSIQQAGFDAAHVMEGDVKNLGVFNQKAIKSALGNRGTYDVTDPDITKAEGGKVEHMQAGGLKTLMGEVLNKGGTYAARRLERAADEIPNLEKLYKDEALIRAFTGDNASAVMTMNPADFEKYAIPIHPYFTTKKFPTLVKDDYSTDDWVKHLKTIQGYDNVPHLMLDKGEAGANMLPIITGHEGRHRNRALADNGVTSGLIQFKPRAELRESFPRGSQAEYINAIRKEMQLTGNRVKPEQYYDPVADQEVRRRAIAMPDLYAEGGVVHKQAGGMMGLVNEFKALQAAHNAARLAKTTKNIPPVQDMIISQAERDANLSRFLENAAVKDRMYHATGDDFSVVDVDKSDPRSKFGAGFYMTPNTNYANFFANMRMKEGKPSQVMPVYTSVKNPYEISGTQNIPFTGIDREKLKALGHDGVLFRNDAGNVQEVVAFDPTQVKSAIGNRGTYDPAQVELTKAEGGAVHSQAEDGDIMRQLFDHALDKGDIHEMTHAMLVKQHEAEYG